jgi:hypothetical protein
MSETNDNIQTFLEFIYNFSKNKGTEDYKYEGYIKYFIDSLKKTLSNIIGFVIKTGFFVKYELEGILSVAKGISMLGSQFSDALTVIMGLLILIEYVVLGNFYKNKQKMLIAPSKKARFSWNDGYIQRLDKSLASLRYAIDKNIFNAYQYLNHIFNKYRSIPYLAFLSEMFINGTKFFGPWNTYFAAYAVFTIISDGFKAYGLYNYMFNHYFNIYYKNEKLTYNEKSLTFFDIKNNSYKLGFTDLFFPLFYRFELKVNKGQSGGSLQEEEEAKFYVGLVNHFFKAIGKNIKILFLLFGYKFIEVSKSVSSFIIPNFIRKFFTGNIVDKIDKEDIKKIFDNKLLIKVRDDAILRDIIAKYKFENIINKENNEINLDKLYKEMIKIDNNVDFLIVHQIYLELKLGNLKNKNDWRVLSYYKKILVARKLDGKR